MTWLSLLGWGAAATAGVMFVLWLLHFPMRNAAIVDVGWALCTGGLGVGYAVAVEGGYSLRSGLLGIMCGIWGGRLAFHLLTDRILGHPEEGRYQELRRSWKTNLGLKFLLFFEFQAALCVVLSIPFLVAALNPARSLHWLEWIGVALWMVAVVGEITADAQLAAFKANPANKGRTCQVGLWHYSRHPNYFFEWLIWVAFALFATTAPYGWLGWISPALILFFLLRLSGIPATEAQALRSRGEEYRKYQQTTSAFVPWFPKAIS